MVNVQEPRYRLVDSNGNVVGSLFQNADGNVEIQDETGTGSVFGPNGIVTPAIDASSVETEELTISNFGGEVHLSDAQEIPNNTRTQIEFDSVENDEFSEFDSEENEIVCARNATYYVTCLITYNANNDWSQGDESLTEPYLNDSATFLFEQFKSGTDTETFGFETHRIVASEGDRIHVENRQRSGETQTISADNTRTVLQWWSV